MSDEVGVLRLMPSGRWAIACEGQAPIEINAGDVIELEVAGQMKTTRTEFRAFRRPMQGRSYRGLPGEYYSIDWYELRTCLAVRLRR